MKTLQEQRTESVLKMQERITELEKENTKLKGLVNQYKASKCSGISLVNRNMIMSDQLTEAKEIIKELYEGLDKLYLSGLSDKQIAFIERLQDKAEQFLKGVEK